eukprot:1263878-Pleurochrysis_carterae.AAC.1
MSHSFLLKVGRRQAMHDTFRQIEEDWRGSTRKALLVSSGKGGKKSGARQRAKPVLALARRDGVNIRNVCRTRRRGLIDDTPKSEGRLRDTYSRFKSVRQNLVCSFKGMSDTKHARSRHTRQANVLSV